VIDNVNLLAGLHALNYFKEEKRMTNMNTMTIDALQDNQWGGFTEEDAIAAYQLYKFHAEQKHDGNIREAAACAERHYESLAAEEQSADGETIQHIPRREWQIRNALSELNDIFCYYMYPKVLATKSDELEAGQPVKDWDKVDRFMERIRQKYSADQLRPLTELEFEELCGKIEALEWVLGDEWRTQVTEEPNS
jgi:hypothetical protein